MPSLPPTLITLTEAAATRMKALLENRGTPNAYVRLGVRTSGCSGLKHHMEFAEAPQEGDEQLEAHGVRVLMDAKAVLYLIGTHVDYEESDVKSGFTFNNPNKKGECGCGSSFTV